MPSASVGQYYEQERALAVYQEELCRTLKYGYIQFGVRRTISVFSQKIFGNNFLSIFERTQKKVLPHDKEVV